MADFHRVLYPHPLHPRASLPFHVSPHLSFSAVRFSPPSRLSCPPIFFCRPSSHSTSPSPSLPSPAEIEIVSSDECPDGSFLFKFGDPSEIEKDARGSGGSSLGEDQGLAEDDKTGSIANAVDEEKSAVSSDDIVLESIVDVKKLDHVVGLTALFTNSSELNEHSATGSAVEKQKASTSVAENGTNFHEESVGIKTDDPNTLSEAGIIVDTQTISPFQEEVSGKIDQNDSPETAMVVDTETSSPSDGEASQEFDGGDAMTLQVLDGLTSSLGSGTVTDIYTSNLSEEEALAQVNDDDVMASKVSLELEMSGEGHSSSKLDISCGTSLNDDPDSLVRDGSAVDDDFVIELMPENVEVEAGLSSEVADNLPSDLLAAEIFQNPVLVDDGACLTTLSDVRTDSVIGNNNVSDCAVGVERADTGVFREEISIPILALASGVASLTCPSQELAGAEDAYVVAEEKWFIVANIVAEWSLEGMKAGLYGHKLLENCRTLISDSGACEVSVREVLEQSAAGVQSPGLLSVLIANFHNGVLHVANIGDTRFIVVRNGFIHKSSSPHFHEFNFPVQIRRTDDLVEVAKEYEVNLDDGDVIVMATDGLFDNLYRKDIASIVSKSLEAKMKPEEIAELLAMRAQEVGRSTSTRSPFSDEAQAAGYAGYSGGKLDHVTVIVSFVKKQSSPQHQ